MEYNNVRDFLEKEPEKYYDFSDYGAPDEYIYNNGSL